MRFHGTRRSLESTLNIIIILWVSRYDIVRQNSLRIRILVVNSRWCENLLFEHLIKFSNYYYESTYSRRSFFFFRSNKRLKKTFWVISVFDEFVMRKGKSQSKYRVNRMFRVCFSKSNGEVFIVNKVSY